MLEIELKDYALHSVYTASFFGITTIHINVIVA